MENAELIVGSLGIVSKLGVLFFLTIYIAFSIIVVRQVDVMIDTLKVGIETPIRAMALAHVVLSILVFVIALLII